MEPEHIFLTVWTIIAITGLSLMYRRGKKVLEIFPSLESVGILFQEKRVSGSSRKSSKTKRGGARNVLEVIITNDELWIRSPLLFASIANTNDLLHKVELSEVLNIELNKENVAISFSTNDKSETTLDLNMKKAKEFIRIIKDKKSTFNSTQY